MYFVNTVDTPKLWVLLLNLFILTFSDSSIAYELIQEYIAQ